MKKKLAILTGIAVAGFSFGAMAVTFAETIPGVDEPYDPTAYYSATAISWADSAPSAFALRDLANNGGSVYDYTRHIKSILFKEKFEKQREIEEKISSDKAKNTENWFNSSISSTIANALSILKGIGNNHKDKDGRIVNNGDWANGSVNSNNQEILNTLGKNLQDNRTSYDFTSGIGGLFWGVPNSEDEAFMRVNTAESYAKQNAWLDNAYVEITDSAKNLVQDQEQILAANAYAQQLSAEADGKVKAQIAQEFAQAVQAQAIEQRTELMGKLAQLRAIESMRQLDEDQKARLITQSASYYTIDPYNEEIYDYVHKTYGVERLQGHGMPDFK